MLRTYGYMNILCRAYLEKRTNVKASRNFLKTILHAAIFHDVGKSFVPKDILNFPGKLGRNTMRIIYRHPDFGIEALDEFSEHHPRYKNFCGNSVLRNVVLFHHEKYDGTGYPLHISGTDIPLEARLMTVADVYDAMVSPRCYKESYTAKSVSEYIMDMKLASFDPGIADIFWSVRKKFFVLTEKNLKNMQESLSSRVL